MTPINFPEQNHTFQKEGCFDVPVWGGMSVDAESKAETPTIISCWKLSAEELEQVKKTGHVWLRIGTDYLPPLNITTEDPFNP